MSDPRGRQAKRTERDARLSSSSREKLGKTAGIMAVGAWATRVEIARMIEQGVPSTKILELIRKGEEGETPLSTTDVLEAPSGSATPGSSVSTPASLQYESPFSVAGGRKPFPSVKESREPSIPSVSPSDSFGRYKSREKPWATGGEQQGVSFKKKATPPPRMKEVHETPEEEWDYVPSSPPEGIPEGPGEPSKETGSKPEGVDPPPQFRKKATPPPDLEKDSREERGAIGYIPKKLPARWGPLEAEKQENFRGLARTLFEDLVILKVEMDLVDSVVEQGEINDETFYMLTEPRSAGTGLRYARLMKKYLAVFEFHGGLEGATPDPFGVPFLQKYLRQLMLDEVGFRTPQSLLYAIEHFAGIFGFESPGSKHPRIRKLAADYAAKAPERSPAPHFEVDFLDYLEGVVLDDKKDLQTRVACGKLRLCIQASVRHSDLAGTAMEDIQWCRPVGRPEVLGLRARAAKTKSGPRPWAAAWVGVNPSRDSGSTCLSRCIGLAGESIALWDVPPTVRAASGCVLP